MNRVLHALVFSIAWLVFPLYGSISTIQQAFALGRAFFVTWLLGYALAGLHGKKAFSSMKVFAWIMFLAAVDQISKLLVRAFLTEEQVIIPYGVSLQRLDNVHHSAVTSFFHLSVSRWGMGAFKVIALILLWFVISKTFEESGEDAYSSLGKILLFSGGLASILDTFLWGYTLDFVYLYGFFTMDIKDLYISLSVGAILLYFWNHRKKKENP